MLRYSMINDSLLCLNKAAILCCHVQILAEQFLRRLRTDGRKTETAKYKYLYKTLEMYIVFTLNTLWPIPVVNLADNFGGVSIDDRCVLNSFH